MSYEVLARKWRPQTFDEVVGQEHITGTLKKAVESGRLSHAYMFSGPRGCGKTSTARILAKVINCANLKDGNPCNECDSCIGVTKGKNLDVMEIDGASHTGVNEVRDLQESIGYTPSQWKNKIYIIDEVHMLSTHAFNALLKTLEEPPKHVYFIFATTAPHKVLETIKSRCQRHHFKRLEIKDISGQLERICKDESVKWEPEALRLLGRKAEGSMRDAESLLDQCITASGGEVVTASVRSILGLLDFEVVHAFLKTIADRDATAALKEVDRAVSEGVDLEELAGALLEGFRDLMLLASGDLSDLIFRSAGELEALNELAGAFELPDLVTIVERLCGLSPRLKTAGDPRILLESVLVDLALLDRQTQIRDLIQRLEGGETRTPSAVNAKPSRPKGEGRKKAESAPKSEEAAPPSPIEARPTLRAATVAKPPPRDDTTPERLDYDALRRMWDGFVTFVRQKKLSLGVSLISGAVDSLDNDTVGLRFARGFVHQKNEVADASNKKFLKSMIKKYFGRELDVRCFLEGEDGGKERARPGPKEGAVGKSPRQQAIESQPIVKKIIDDFDGEIVRYFP